MKNYLEHEIKVKFVDGILERNQEWQWFINCIEQEFELDDISNYDEFKRKIGPLKKVLMNFISIIEISDKNWTFNKQVLLDLFEIARFSVGGISIETCKKIVLTNIGKILLSIVWLTKLENSDNKTEYVVDMRFLVMTNFHQVIKMQSFALEQDEIIEYLDLINVEGFEVPRKCIKDNLLQISYDVTEGFIEKYRNNLLSPNAFSFQSVQKNEYLPWQEDTLLDMLSVSIKDKSIVPMFSSGNNIVPDYRLWTSDLIKQIKEFFNSPAVDFVTETIDYINNDEMPSQDVIYIHCKLLKELIEAANETEILSSSTYAVLSALFSDDLMKNVEKNGDLLELFRCIHKIHSVRLLLKLREDGFPLAKGQNREIKKYIMNQYKIIEEINDIHLLQQYLSNEIIAKNLTQLYYDMIMPCFLKIVKENPREGAVPILFYQAMLFLIEVNQTNQQVDKRKVKIDMINLQEYWQNNVYVEQCKTVHKMEYSTLIKTEDVKKFNNAILSNPIILAKKCLITSTEEMINKMAVMSEHAIIYMVNRMTLSPIYPTKENCVDFDKHDIDVILRKQVEDIKRKYGYKFLNDLPVDTYVTGIHKYYCQFANYAISMFKEDEKLYHKIEKILNVKFISYKKEIQLGHLAQLFPILEIQIRKLGKMVGIVPFKEKESEFMKFKDPSSVLRDLLENVYQELENFVNVPDLLFVYHFMYNGNSLNIRNECIHGRNYLAGNQLEFAFKTTLLALYMIIYRIMRIEEI